MMSAKQTHAERRLSVLLILSLLVLTTNKVCKAQGINFPSRGDEALQDATPESPLPELPTLPEGIIDPNVGPDGEEDKAEPAPQTDAPIESPVEPDATEVVGTVAEAPTPPEPEAEAKPASKPKDKKKKKSKKKKKKSKKKKKTPGKGKPPKPKPTEPQTPAEPQPEETKPVEPVTDAPQPVEPQPVEPVTDAPQPVEPQPVEPVTEAPKPAEPQPVEPVTDAPQPVEPQPVEPVTEAPKPVEPQPVEPVTEKPIEPQPVEPVTEAPKPVEPRPVEPVTEKPKPRKPKPVEPVTEKPKPRKPKPVEPVTEKPKPKKPEVVKVKPVKPKPTKPPVVKKPQVPVTQGPCIDVLTPVQKRQPCPGRWREQVRILNLHVDKLKTDNEKLWMQVTEIHGKIKYSRERISEFHLSTNAWKKRVAFPEDFEDAKDCNDALGKGHKKPGVYLLNPNSPYNVRALCVNGWTVIQRRFDGTENFNRDFDDYVAGFGNFSGEFILGLENLHLLTKETSYTLRVDVKGASGKWYYAVYEDFSLSDEQDEYRLLVGNMTAGNFFDGFENGRNQQFSTYDRDNDEWVNGNCAHHYGGGWWSGTCETNLNQVWCRTGCMQWASKRVVSSIMRIKPTDAVVPEDVSENPNPGGLTLDETPA